MSSLNIQTTRPKSVTSLLTKFLEVFDPKDRVLITIDPDPDSLSSAMAVKRILWHKVQSTTIAIIRPITRLNNITMVRLLKIPVVDKKDINLSEFDRHVIVDGQPAHFEEFQDINFNVVIDHHPLKEEPQGVDFADIRPTYGATATILTEYLKAAKIKPSKTLATALIYGIKTDTHDFQGKVVEEDVKAFRYLFPFAFINTLRKIEISDMELKDLKFFKRALENKRVSRKRIFTYLERVPSHDICVLVADFLMKIHDIRWVVVSGLTNDKLVVVIRNDGIRKNAGRLAEKAFGSIGSAGGHKGMARAEIPLENLEQYLRKFNANTIQRFIRERFLKRT